MNDDGNDTDDVEVQRVQTILNEEFTDRVFSVEDGVVWVSGMNMQCMVVAKNMAQTLAHDHDIPTSLIHGDGADRFGGVQFNWGESA